MTPLIVALLGIVALAAGAAVLVSLGGHYRVGRLLASTPRVTVAEARVIAERGEPRYVRIDGRIDAEDEFEDADHRPLVFRRTRFEARRGRTWTVFEDSREAAAFEIREGLDAIAIDPDALDEGLVVVPRESAGTAADVPDRAPPDLPPATPVRVRIEHVSSVEHAIVLGRPSRTDDGRPILTAGLGRPLVLTTLEPPEAMRLLAGGSARPRLAAVLLGAGLVLLAVAGALGLASALLPPGAAAATPSAAPGAGGDPRSAGEGPGLVGEPGLAIVVVVAIALASALATLAWVRLTAGRDRP